MPMCVRGVASKVVVLMLDCWCDQSDYLIAEDVMEVVSHQDSVSLQN